jgi:hypothetical protein
LKVTIYVEGGGDDNLTKTNCRKGFRKFIERMFPGKNMPSIVACQSRSRALKDFRIALQKLEEGEQAFLLVDSEAPVAPGNSPWKHFKERQGDEWDRPEGATDEQAHMMVQCMESWFLADRESVAEWYDKGFKISKLPPLQNGSIEPIEKERVVKSLEDATKHTSKSTYHKTKHGFKLMEEIEPSKVRAASIYAERLYKALEKCLDDKKLSPGS